MITLDILEHNTGEVCESDIDDALAALSRAVASERHGLLGDVFKPVTWHGLYRSQVTR